MHDIYAQQNTMTTDNIIKIGLLIRDSRSMAAQNGAEMAINKANEKEGNDGLHFQLVIRSMEGPWGTGSKEAVNLVFKEKVWAIMGSHDARNAHLVEQVISKTSVVFLSAWASDPTLSQAFIPWYFSCVPNDIQQADALIEEIYNKRKITKIAIVIDNDYDSNLTLKSLLKEIEIANETVPKQLFYDSSNWDFKILLDEIKESNLQGIILIGQPSASFRFIEQLRQRKMNQPVFGTLSLLGESQFDDLELVHYDNVTLVTSGNWFNSKQLSFQNEFQEKYGKRPGAVAAYAFDGMNLIIEAIKLSDLDREKIQGVMTKTHFKGVTGSIQFDEKGNRLAAAQLIELNNEILATFEK
jgi:ABC-type branched-subunit amino acid transport system substrate-binding protein